MGSFTTHKRCTARGFAECVCDATLGQACRFEHQAAFKEATTLDEGRYAEVTRLLAADANRRREARWDDLKAGVMRHNFKPHWQDGKG